jgi:hypothetical protein
VSSNATVPFQRILEIYEGEKERRKTKKKKKKTMGERKSAASVGRSQFPAHLAYEEKKEEEKRKKKNMGERKSEASVGSSQFSYEALAWSNMVTTLHVMGNGFLRNSK